jgi:nuclear receptor interaction protein
MPYSNDRTIVSATDHVRIFDIEHSGHSALGSGSRSSTARRSVGMARDGVTLTEGDTNAKVFRSHTDTVKRIVTEDTPFYFLTCSNDGDVRQWDVRQPSKAYPQPKDARLPSWARDEGNSDNAPPPLISYSRYGLDLNTVSCSPSQPHYIALGGAHLHCFLHDRRMLGRDRNMERGSRLPSPGAWSENDDELLGKATQCVKKFAPSGKKRMRRNDGGHITACKISDAHPNELIVSWSHDHIYSFDMLRAPDASEQIKLTRDSNGESGHRVKDQLKKRKRPKSRTLSEEAAERGSSRQRTESSEEDLALRVTYENGQTEDIRIETPAESGMSREELDGLRSTDHYRFAKTTVTIKKRIFGLAEHGETGLRLAFTSILGFANSILSDMDDAARAWGYPVDPDPVDVAVQNMLRDSRAASRRFVQAAGTLARALGGQLLTGANSDALIAKHFASIQHAPRERELPQHEQFGYDFLKAVLLWLDSGPSAVVEGFSSRSPSTRCPCPQDSDMDAIPDLIIPYLLELASDEPIVNVDVSRFNTDDTRVLFETEKAAVLAFAQALRIPFADLTGAVVPTSGNRTLPCDVQDRTAARRRWAYQVGRGVLYNASKDVKFKFVDRAFGGRGIADSKIRAEEQALREEQEDIDSLDDEGPVTEAELVGGTRAQRSSTAATGTLSPSDSTDGTQFLDIEEDGEDSDDDEDDYDDEESDADAESFDEHDDDDDDDDEYDDEDGDGLRRTRSGRMLWRSDFGRSRFKKEKAELDVPCAPHTRIYTGHCNVKTVKDVNFFGLQDDYVVSGSDSGHVFIWDRKTTQLLNILEGDGEVVNVVQGMPLICLGLWRLLMNAGHPYEPTMAVSGIDHTIKIFSPDSRDQRNARKGIGVQSSDAGGFSTLNWGRRRRPEATEATDEDDPRPAEALSDSDEEVASNGLRSRKRMHEAYQITSKNDMDRKGGREDYFISVSRIFDAFAAPTDYLQQAVFAQLARHLATQQAGGGEGGEGPVVVTEENCSVM